MHRLIFNPEANLKHSKILLSWQLPTIIICKLEMGYNFSKSTTCLCLLGLQEESSHSSYNNGE